MSQNKLSSLAALSMLFALQSNHSGSANFGNPETCVPKSPKKVVQNGHSEFTIEGIPYFALNRANAEKKHQKWLKTLNY